MNIMPKLFKEIFGFLLSSFLLLPNYAALNFILAILQSRFMVQALLQLSNHSMEISAGYLNVIQICFAISVCIPLQKNIAVFI